MDNIRIMIVDDSMQILNYFNSILTSEPGMEVVGMATNSKEAIEVVKVCNPDIILMDIEMETKTSGIDAIKPIKEIMPDVKVIMNTIYSDDEHIVKSFEMGALDYVTKSSSSDEILSVIRAAYNNSTRELVAKSLVNEMAKRKIQQESVILTINKLIKLTSSEMQILKLIYEGKRYSEIAKFRFVEEATVRSFVNKILKKFERKNMKMLIKELRSMKIIEFLDLNDE